MKCSVYHFGVDFQKWARPNCSIRPNKIYKETKDKQNFGNVYKTQLDCILQYRDIENYKGTS